MRKFKSLKELSQAGSGREKISCQTIQKFVKVINK